MAKLVSEIIEAKPGVKCAVHVFTPALLYRIEKRVRNLNVMAVRMSTDNYQSIRLYSKIDFLGPCSLEDLFDNPLPATNGRGISILFTEFPIQVWYYKGKKPSPIDLSGNRQPTEVLREILKMTGRLDIAKEGKKLNA